MVNVHDNLGVEDRLARVDRVKVDHSIRPVGIDDHRRQEQQMYLDRIQYYNVSHLVGCGALILLAAVLSEGKLHC